MNDKSSSPLFADDNGWGWYNRIQHAINKVTGGLSHITIVGKLDACMLDVWSCIDDNVLQEANTMFQWVESEFCYNISVGNFNDTYLYISVLPPDDEELRRQYFASIENLKALISIATERWPFTGFMYYGERLRFTHTTFRDRSQESSVKRSVCKCLYLYLYHVCMIRC